MATTTELYRFAEQGSALIWTFTSGNEPIVYDVGSGDETYDPTSISRTEAEAKNDLSRANLAITVPLTNAAAQRWLADNGEKIVTLTIFERGKDGTISVVWKGRLASVAPGMTSITLNMESVFTSLRRPGLRARYQRSCRHAVYGRGCNLDPEDFAFAGTASASANRTLTIAEAATKPDGYFSGGMLRTADGQLSYVVKHVGSAITIQHFSRSILDEISGGFPFTVTLYPGCDRSYATCASKFANDLNYGGFDYIPKKNPTGGSSIV
jgi:uncharacterized phage protein (TIGR02218 family)